MRIGRTIQTIAGMAWALALMAGSVGLAGRGAAAPLDLADPTPRWIEVRFEVSPENEPGALDRSWSPARRAYLEPVVLAAGSGATHGGTTQVAHPTSDGAERADRRVIRIRIPSDEIEAQLRSAGTDAVAGSFSEFVWTLDPATGHVLSAALEGEVREELRLGPIRTSAQIAIRVDMGTDRHAGFVPDARIMGVPANRFCAPQSRDEDCVAVPPVPYDPRRGYVNAVGTLRAASVLAELLTFSPLGEVEFRERVDGRQGGTEAAFGGTPLEDAICSRTVDTACPADLGGES